MFQQFDDGSIFAWASTRQLDDREGGECEDGGAQRDDEGDISDSGIGDIDGSMEHVVLSNGFAGLVA